MSLGEAALQAAQEALEATRAEKAADGRAVICACGHTVRKHERMADGRDVCFAPNVNCKCVQTTPVLLAPNARAFMYRNDAKPALFKGIAKSAELGVADRLDWATGCATEGCAREPVTVLVESDGRDHLFTPRCEEHG